MWEVIKEYYLALGEKYQVDPVIFVTIHILATPPFLAASWWIVRNKKQHKSILLPVLAALLFFNGANLYLVIAGTNIPFWIYALIGIMTLFSGYTTFLKIKKKIGE